MNWSVDQTLSISAPRDSFNPTRWVVERVRKDSWRCGARSPQGGCRGTEARSHTWIDGDTCPALAVALGELGEIQMPPFAGTREIGVFVTDHTPYLTIEGRPKSLKRAVHPRYHWSTLERISIREQEGFFRQWWDKTEAALKPCWQAVAPSIDGKPLQARLAAPN